MVEISSCFDSYFNHRLAKIRELHWSTGIVLPEKILRDLSARENDYYTQYYNLMGEYNSSIELDLASDIEVSCGGCSD